MSIYPDKEHGGFVYQFDRRVGGKRVRLRKRLPKTWNRAQAEAHGRKEDARLYGLATGLERPEATIDQAVALYLQDKKHLKSYKGAAENIAAVYWAYADKGIMELPAVAREIATVDAWAPATVKQRISLLRSACRWAWKQGMCEHDPGARVVVPTVSNSRTVSITERELLRALKFCPDAVKPAVAVAFYSGMRLGEVMRAEPVRGVWVLHTTKNGEPRHVPIHPKVTKYAKNWTPGNRRTVQKWWRIAATAIGRPEVRFHDLRHSTATAMINAGVPLYTVGQVLGHKSPVSTQRYAHLQQSSLKAAIAMVGARPRKVA